MRQVPSSCRSTTWLPQILSKSVRGFAMVQCPISVRGVAGLGHYRRGGACPARLSHRRDAGRASPAPTNTLREARPGGEASAFLRRLLRGGGRGRLAGGAVLAAALLDARRLAGAAAQVIELGAAHLAAAHDLDRGEAGRVEREDALDPLAVRDLAQREARV